MGEEKKRVVGLARNRIGIHNAIEFTYIRKSDGKKSIEGQFYISGDKIAKRDFRKQNRKGMVLVLVPLGELEPLTREEERKPDIPQSRLDEIHDIFTEKPEELQMRLI